MEKIDLNNYEAYFLDYMEGSLSAEEKFDLFGFLDQHPELKADLDEDLADMALMPETITFDSKASLKVDEDSMIITPATVDELMIAAVEGQLLPKQKFTLEKYVSENGLGKQYAYYKATLLQPDTRIRYKNKAALKQNTGSVISMTWVTRVASIAAVGVILVMVALNWNDGTTIGTEQSPAFFASEFKTHQRLNLDRREIANDEVMQTSEQWVAENDQSEPQQDPSPQQESLPINLVPDPNLIVEDAQDNESEKEELDVLPVETEIKEDMANQPVDPEKDKVPESELPENTTEEYASVNEMEEPYKLVTNAASNLINRDVSFTREKDKATDDYVAYSFKLGKFEFERKKAK